MRDGLGDTTALCFDVRDECSSGSHAIIASSGYRTNQNDYIMDWAIFRHSAKKEKQPTEHLRSEISSIIFCDFGVPRQVYISKVGIEDIHGILATCASVLAFHTANSDVSGLVYRVDLDKRLGEHPLP